LKPPEHRVREMEGKGRQLTRREFEDVMRRAAELAARDSEGDDRSMSETEILRIAGEVGLPEAHVRRALAEVRSGLAVQGTGFGRLLGPTVVRAGRVVAGSQGEISRSLDEFLVAGQLLQAVRRGKDVLVYRPAVDWASQIARAASATSRRYYVASAKQVEIRLSPMGEGQVAVEMEVDPGTRDDYVAGLVLGGGTVAAAAGVGAGFLLAVVAPVVIAVAGGIVAGVGAGAAVARISSRQHRKKLSEVHTEMEGILDRLEAGESLEPPPPSWRRWVRRHFHGVARDLRGDDDDMMDSGGMGF
jgi:acyl-coenzyme A thioesterase PaaI-like protein